MIDTSTPEYEAALALSMMQVKETRRFGENGPEGLTHFDVAELIMGAKHGLFYSQLQGWAASEHGIPPHVPEDVKVREWVKNGVSYLIAILESGFNEEHRQWWYLPALWGTERGEHFTRAMCITLLGVHLKDLSNQTTYLVPASAWVILDIILGEGWYERALSRFTKAKNRNKRRF